MLSDLSSNKRYLMCVIGRELIWDGTGSVKTWQLALTDNQNKEMSDEAIPIFLKVT